MFNWFKGRSKDKYPTWEDVPPPESSNVVKFPEIKPPAQPDPKIYYRFGLTDNNRVAFQMGYSEITMNREGCQNLIDQLTFFMNQIEDEDESQDRS